MKLLLTLTLLFVATVAFTQENKTKTEQKPKQTEYVYLCNGSSSKKYHKTENCRGLSNCSTKIQKTTKSDAVSKGRTACKICYK